MNSSEKISLSMDRSALLADRVGGTPISESSFGEDESLRGFLRTLRKRKGFILLAVAGCLALSLLVCFVMQPKYTSTVTLLIDKDNGGIDLGGLSGVAAALSGSDDLKTDLQTHTDMLESDSTVLAVAKELNLEKVRPFKVEPGPFDRLLGWNKKLNEEVGRPIEDAPLRRERLIAIFGKRMKVLPATDSRLIQVSVEDANPEQAAKIANSIASVYTERYLENRFKSTALATEWLSEQLNGLKARVESAQEKLSDYERRSGLSVLMLGLMSSGEQGGGGGGGMRVPAIDKLAALNQEVTSAEANSIAKEAIYHLTQTQSPDVVLGLGASDLTSFGGGSAVISQGSGLEVLSSLRQQQAGLEVNYADAEARYGANNPRLAQIRSQINALQGQVDEELVRINQRAKNDFTLAKTAEVALGQSYKLQQAAVDDVNDSATHLEVLAGEALSTRQLYDGLYTKLQEAGIQAGVKATNISVADPARAAATPTRPSWIIYPGIGLLAGLLLGTGGAFARENLDDAVITPHQVENLSRYPVLAYIPTLRGEDLKQMKEWQIPNSEAEPSLLVTKPNVPHSEAYRTLRTNLLMSTAGEPLKTLLVTSPLVADGKTTVSYNLAIAFAQQGRSVLLIDADMRNSRMHRLMHVAKTPGLSGVLTAAIPPQEAIRKHRTVPGLSFLPAGVSPPMSSELLSSPHFDRMLAEFRESYDMVVIDSAPMLLVTDATILSSKVDGTIVVVRSNVTTRPVLARVSEMLGRSEGYKLGFVLNDVDTNSIDYYDSYGYYGGNTYYGNEA